MESGVAYHSLTRLILNRHLRHTYDFPNRRKRAVHTSYCIYRVAVEKICSYPVYKATQRIWTWPTHLPSFWYRCWYFCTHASLQMVISIHHIGSLLATTAPDQTSVVQQNCPPLGNVSLDPSMQWDPSTTAMEVSWLVWISPFTHRHTCNIQPGTDTHREKVAWLPAMVHTWQIKFAFFNQHIVSNLRVKIKWVDSCGLLQPRKANSTYIFQTLWKRRLIIEVISMYLSEYGKGGLGGSRAKRRLPPGQFGRGWATWGQPCWLFGLLLGVAQL